MTPTSNAYGYWGAITANYDWCETNYAHSHYIAEFFNTLSSIPIALVGLAFVRKSLRFRYGLKFVLAGFGVFVVGVGSVAFHGTLLREGQVLDEVPMLWSALLFLWIALALRCPPNEVGTRRASQLGALLGMYGVLSTAVYLRGSFEFFIGSYILTVAAIATVSVLQLVHSARRRVVLPYAIGSLIFYIGGVALLWVPEQVLCGNRLHAHHDSALLGLPVPLHAFFHLTSATGPLLWLTFAVYEMLNLHKRKPTIQHEVTAELCGIPTPLVACILPQ